MPIDFDPFHKWIKIDFDWYTIQSATQGSTIVVVNQSISTLTPSEGFIQIGTSKGNEGGIADLASGYDWATNPQNFVLTSILGESTISLNINCNTFSAVLTHLNERMSGTATLFNHSTYLEWIAHPDYPNHVLLQYKDGYEGSAFGFQLKAGSIDALQTLGISSLEKEFGDADRYNYSSYSGSTFYLTTSLTKSYSANVGCIASYKEIDMQDVYNEAMDWSDSQAAMDDSVPMATVGKKDLGGGVYTDIVFELLDGWKLRLWNGTYSITIIGTVITSDGSSPLAIPIWGTSQVEFRTGTTATIIKPIVGSSEQISIAEKVWTVTDGAKVRKITTNRWKIDGNQLIIYDEDGTTVLMRFDLKDKEGIPSETNVYERVPV